MTLLDKIKSTRDIRSLSRSTLHRLVTECRERHVDVVSKTGGHFGASLGVAELTVALHSVFDTPRDKLKYFLKIQKSNLFLQRTKCSCKVSIILQEKYFSFIIKIK